MVSIMLWTCIAATGLANIRECSWGSASIWHDADITMVRRERSCVFVYIHTSWLLDSTSHSLLKGLPVRLLLGHTAYL
jgi:hypothetical protein